MPDENQCDPDKRKTLNVVLQLSMASLLTDE